MNYAGKEIEANRIAQEIDTFAFASNLFVSNITALEKQVLARQIVDRINRVKYFEIVGSRGISPNRADPSHDLFDPIRAVFFHKHSNNLEEALWLSFLIVHFGENYQSGWKLTRNFYNNFGQEPKLTWDNVNSDPNLVDDWVDEYNQRKQNLNIKLKFGNHRKFQSIKHLRQVIDSYLDFTNSKGGQIQAFSISEGNSRQRFARLFKDINFYGFARLGKFDFLSILYKFDLVEIEADCCYIKGSTGPKDGAEYLFGNLNSSELDNRAQKLADYLGIGYQEMEDALCNWHKSTDKYMFYRG